MKKPVANVSEKPLKLMKLGSVSEIYRIIPIGFTLEEARGWYLNHVLLPRLRWPSAALGAASTILAVMSTGLGHLLEQDLTTHMIVHDLLLLVAGFLLIYGISFLMQISFHKSDRLWQSHTFVNMLHFGGEAVSVLPFASAVLLIGYWYLPAQFSVAATNVEAQLQMQLAFLIAGGLIFVGASFLSRRLKLIALVAVGKLLGLYGMLLLLIPTAVYSTYPAYEQTYAGAALLFLMLILDFTIMPLWLYNYFRKGASNSFVSNHMD